MNGRILSRNDFLELRDRGALPVREPIADEQIQPNGIELTLAQVAQLQGPGRLGRERLIPDDRPLEFDASGWVELQPGTYRVRFREIVDIPLDSFALARPRSSLLRMGASLGTALWDSGYSGRSEALLVVHNPDGISLEAGCRMLQLVFFGLSEPVDEGYNGRYQGENLKEAR